MARPFLSQAFPSSFGPPSPTHDLLTHISLYARRSPSPTVHRNRRDLFIVAWIPNVRLPPSHRIFVFFSSYRRVFGFTDPVAPPSSGTMPEPSSPETQTPAQPSQEPHTPDNGLFSSMWGYSSPVLDHIQSTATSPTATMSPPSTPSTTSSLVPSSPNYTQHHAIPDPAMDAQDSVPTPAFLCRASDDKRKKTSRPPNAFMLFRSWLIRDGKLPPGVEKRQQNVSKIAGMAWKLLDEASKDVWRAMACELLEDHRKKYPGYKFDRSPKNCRKGLEKIRKALKDSDEDTARRLKALSDVYARGHRAVDLPTPRHPRREGTSPFKLSTALCTPQRSARGSKNPQLATGSQPAPSPKSPLSLTTFDSPSPSSVQLLSPLPLCAQPNAFTPEMAQHPLPDMFLPPELPDHSQQAYQQENAVRLFVIPRSMCSKLTGFLQTIVFSVNYTPVNPFALPSEWYDFDYTGIFPPVVDTSEMMTGASNNTATMLGLYELNPPYAHLNPRLTTSGDGIPVYQSSVQMPQTANSLSIPHSTTFLTPHDQEVFSAILGNPQLPFTLENLVPLPLPLPENGLTAGSPSAATSSSLFPLSTSSAPFEELSLVEPQTNQAEGSAPATSQPPTSNQCA